MNRFSRPGLTAAVVGLLVSGCVHPLMSRRNAIDTANRTAEAAGYRLADYRRPKAEFSHYPNLKTGVGEAQEWWVHYEPKVELRATNAYGNSWVTNFLDITVDGKTGAATLDKATEPD